MEELYGRNKIEITKDIKIPRINDNKLLELYNKIKPIVTIKEQKYLLKEFELLDLRGISYLENINKNKKSIIDINRLEIIDDFLCLHTYAYSTIFKPSIAEVLAQYPNELIDKSNLFEIIEKPITLDDITKYRQFFDCGYHLSKVRAYKLHN